MSNNGLGEIRAIQKKMVLALEKGEDISELSRQLAKIRAEIARQADIEGAKKVAAIRLQLRDKAEAVKIRVQKQDKAIDRFLAARDEILPRLQSLIEPVWELARMGNTSWEADPGECYLFNDTRSFSASVINIPKELLPRDFSCPTLEMIQPGEQSFGKARQAFQYFQYCIGILSSFKKGSMPVLTRPTDDSLLLDNEPETTGANCLVCQHERVTEINKALQDGRPLRELENEFEVSRSTLSRHKRSCLGIEAVRFVDSE